MTEIEGTGGMTGTEEIGKMTGIGRMIEIERTIEIGKTERK